MFKELLNKEMNRREFLAHIGALFLALIGIGALLRTISNPHLLKLSDSHTFKKSNGYGSGSYGGKEGGLNG